MLRSLMSLGFVLICGILVYNYFFGSPDEKATSGKIFGETKNLVVSVKDLLKSEKSKFDSGKYDKAINQVDGIIEKLRGEASSNNQTDLLSKIEDLEKRKERLDGVVQDIKKLDPSKQDKMNPKVSDAMDALVRETEVLIQEAEKGGK
jgi:hypothetical protein